MSGRSARSIRNFSLELSQDLVLPNVGQVDFHDFRKYWNFNVQEMALKTFRFVQGLSRTPLLFSSISHRHIFQKYVATKTNIENRKSGSLTKQVKVLLFVSAGTASHFPDKNQFAIERNNKSGKLKAWKSGHPKTQVH